MRVIKSWIKIFLLTLLVIVILQLSLFLNVGGCEKAEPPEVIDLIATEYETLPKGVVGIEAIIESSENKNYRISWEATGGNFCEEKPFRKNVWIAPDNEGDYQIFFKTISDEIKSKEISIKVDNSTRGRFKFIGETLKERSTLLSSGCSSPIDNENILICNGTVAEAWFSDSILDFRSCEIFNIKTGSSLLTSSFKIITHDYLSLRLNDGRVFIIGGYYDIKSKKDYIYGEIYNPINERFEIIGMLEEAKNSYEYIIPPTPYLLKDGTVLLVGKDKIYKFYPDIKNFETIFTLSPVSLNSILMTDERILLFYEDSSVGIFDLGSKSIKILSSKMNIFRKSFLLSNLIDGRVLIIGGYDNTGHITKIAEIFDPQDESFKMVGETNFDYPPQNALSGESISLLDSGKVLITGTSRAETFDPASNVFTPVGSIGVYKDGYQKVKTLTGDILIIGGNECSGKQVLMYVE